jgi:hypothetical protein
LPFDQVVVLLSEASRHHGGTAARRDSPSLLVQRFSGLGPVARVIGLTCAPPVQPKPAWLRGFRGVAQGEQDAQVEKELSKSCSSISW